MERLQVETSDGRRLDVEIGGPPDGRPLLFQVGTPSAGVLHPALVELGSARGLRHITYSRPGYGRSNRLPGRRVADCVADIEAVLAALGVERFHTVGWSGGGPHALACAALLGDRTIAAATLGGVAPRDAAGIDWLEGMGEENLAEFGAAEAGDEPLEAFLRIQREDILAAGGPEIQASLGQLLSPVDREAATGEFAEYLATLFHGGLETDVWGWFDDDLACVGDWGFDLAAVTSPVAVWHGSEDRFVPYDHGRWLAANVPGAQPRLLDGEGHLSILLGAYGRLLDDLLALGD
jgi:pimeloyl-ACP methyl ester carboxylesterase